MTTILKYCSETENNDDDGFDRVPDSLIHLIFNRISDIKTLIRCRSVSKRFNSLVPQADTLLLTVDRVVSASDPADSALLTFLRSIFKPIFDLVSPKQLHDSTRWQKSPAQILRGFERVRELHLELPSGDLRLEKGAVIRWRAEFGKTLRGCVILGFRTAATAGGVGGGDLVGGGLKMRVVWTITALIAASTRHYYMVKEVVKEQEALERLVVRDKEEEGTVVMERDGLKECRESWEEEEKEEAVSSSGGGGNRRGVWWRNNRTKVPAVRMRMRHVPRLELSGGGLMEGATLVVVKPINGSGGGAETEEEEDVSGMMAYGAFGGGLYGEAVEKLLKSRSYILEMNSF
ncbi:hypothetical protein Vadar_034080 [Vaccinium darrowii]|uniref:Uncharacterized protein n=1 Tax=Vaccinium darrowii TaxID=229202 RepID=A0ACB7YBM0_9ERIC|nr:hypothetical protein Vadar_034080 [Vaccinium darrowii]